MIRTHNKLSRPRRAVILVIVLWIVVVLTVIAYSLTYEMRVSMKMTGHSIKQVKARGLARAGLAQDEDGGVRPGNLLGLGENLLHGSAAADDLLVPVLEHDFIPQVDVLLL